MSKRKQCKLAAPKQLGLDDSTCTNVVIDWRVCVLCQQDTSETLLCPANSKKENRGAGYDTLARDLEGFIEVGENLVLVDLESLNTGDGIRTTLRNHSAKWHSSCRLCCSASRLKRFRSDKHAFTELSNAERPSTREQKTTNIPKAGTCFFCEEYGNTVNPLHDAMISRLTQRVTECAIKTKNHSLIAKLSSGDMVAQDAKYHSKCLVKLYNACARLNENHEPQNNDDSFLQGVALVELMGFIDDTKLADPSISPIFKLADLSRMYADRLAELGVTMSGRLQSTHLKNRLLSNIPGLQSYKQGRDVMLVFDDDIGNALKEACRDSADEEVLCLAKAAEIIRRDMIKKTFQFDGSFSTESQEEAVPNSLVVLVNMVMNGHNIKQTSTTKQTTMSIAQLLQFNSSIRRSSTATGLYHLKHRETPLAIYLGLMVHGRTRRRDLIDTLFNLGLSISYDRVLNISTNMAAATVKQFETDGVVCPLILRKNLFTLAAVDNYDHNLSSNTAHGAIHGTGISLLQNRNTLSDGIKRDKVEETDISNAAIPSLPDFYTSITPLVTKKDSAIPPLVCKFKCDNQILDTAIEAEQKWQTNTGRNVCDREEPNLKDPLCWASYHSRSHRDQNFSVAISALLPLFTEDSKSMAMIRHSMDVVQKAVHHLNPGQVPVITFDQPLYAISKQIQWAWPDNYGETKFIVMLGGLHIEMAVLTTLGDLLDGSGWTHALAQAEIATPGTADSFLKASHVKRTRHAHQVSVVAFSILRQKAYELSGVSDDLTFTDWCTQRTNDSPQFQFWSLIMKLETLMLVYVRAIRDANFPMYVAALDALAPWFFSLNHTHYSRWLPIHIRDMMTLGVQHPEVAREFNNGGFVVYKTKRVFSSMSIDQAHEQMNKLIKGDGGAIGLLQNTKALLRWTVAGPEVARIIEEFEVHCLDLSLGDGDDNIYRHHEHATSNEKNFAKEVNALVIAIEEWGNPFAEESTDLLVLDTRDVCDSAVYETLGSIEQLGEEQYKAYVDERIVKRTTAIMDPIPKNKLALFNRPSVKPKSREKQLITSLKSDCALFSRLYISCQTRNGDLDNFFKYENGKYPPSLTQTGKIRPGTKSDLVERLEKYCTSKREAPPVDVMIVDGAAVVNMLKPKESKTFLEYSTDIFLPYIKAQMRNVSRIDIIWDVYLADSLKSETREARGRGVRRRVEAMNKIPGNWGDFLRLSENKTELFAFLAHQVTENLSTDKEVYTTLGQSVLSTRIDQDVSSLAPCSHEEADTRMLLHAYDAVNKGYRKVMLRTVDTDVLVLAVFTSAHLNNAELWVAFSSGTHLRYIPAHEIAAGLGNDSTKALPMFHAFTGCDTVSSFTGRGKKTAFDVWRSFEEVTQVFMALTTSPSNFNSDHMSTLEKYVILLYDRECPETTVNAARRYIFTTQARSIDAIPPTQAALLQKTKRAILQGGHVWGQTLVCSPTLPSPDEWGWQKIDDQGWKPLWTLLPEAGASCSELLRCGCEKGCRGNCKCFKAALKCTSLCRCNGDCEYNDSK